MTDLQKSLYQKIISDITKFCELNNIDTNSFVIKETNCYYSGEYYDNTIEFNPKHCSTPRAIPIRSWSFPGYFVDKTIYGVIAHEFGHFIDDIFKQLERNAKLCK